MPIKTPNEISAAYYQFVDEFTQSDFEDEKLLGKFYTDYDIAGSMMRLLSKRYVCDTFSSELHIIDPFCGDGRLIISLQNYGIQVNYYQITCSSRYGI